MTNDMDTLTDKIIKESKYYNQETGEFDLDWFISDCITSGMFGGIENNE